MTSLTSQQATHKKEIAELSLIQNEETQENAETDQIELEEMNTNENQISPEKKPTKMNQLWNFLKQRKNHQSKKNGKKKPKLN